MATVYLGIGSNIRPVENLRMAIDELRTRFGEVELSTVYRSKPLGFEGEDFLNLVAQIKTELPAEALCRELDNIHAISGRERGCAKFVSRPLDIDLLLYDREIIEEPPVRVPRSDVLEYSFVIVPLAELAPDYVHPVTGKTIAQALEEFDLACHPLERQDVIL